MIEIPEAVTLAKQLNETVKGKKIAKAVAAHSPHKFAWYQGDPAGYDSLLKGKQVGSTEAAGGMVEIHVDETLIVLSEGIALRYHEDEKTLPKKHQLLIEFEDGTYLSVSIQMYGGILCFKQGGGDNEYYLIAKEKPSPYSKVFTEEYFRSLIDPEELSKKSAKFVLATEQRIPGFGNGVLQDVLFAAKIHPKRKMDTISNPERTQLFKALKGVLGEMAEKGGRDTEKNLFGEFGGYQTKLSKNTAGTPCSVCGTTIEKQSYMGGSVYVCPTCQKL